MQIYYFSFPIAWINLWIYLKMCDWKGKESDVLWNICNLIGISSQILLLRIFFIDLLFMNCIFSIYLPYFVQKNDPLNVPSAACYWHLHIIIMKFIDPWEENAFSFSFRKQIFLHISFVFQFFSKFTYFGMQLNWGFHKSSFTLCSQEWKGIMHLTDRDDNGCFMHILKNKLNAFFPLVPISYLKYIHR